MKVHEFNGVPFLRRNTKPKVYGTVWRSDEDRYTYGQCHALALAILMERPQWTLHAEWYYDLGGYPDHVYVVADGRYTLDIEGIDVLDNRPPNAPISFKLLEEMVAVKAYALPLVDAHTRGIAQEVIAEYEGAMV